MGIRFPDADYFIASSRLRPGLDGGYTIATLRRAQQFAEHAGVNPVLLTFDFWPEYEQVKADFASLGLMSGSTVIRNLLQDARSAPEFLRRRASPRAGGEPPQRSLSASTDTDSAGRPWRTTWTDDASGDISHTDFLDFDGRPVLRVPYVTGRADWHQAPIEILVFGGDGHPVGTLAGFGELYRVWVEHVVGAEGSDRLKMVVCESRQVGELLVELPGDRVRLVHTVHSAHTSAPYEWDSPIDGLWASWFEVIDGFDAVIWLTEKQRHAVERRFGPRANFWVVPHAVDPAPTIPSTAERDPDLAVMIGRVAALKRLDHALDAFRGVVAANPRARLAIYGDGPDEERLRALANEYGIQDAVEFHGHEPGAAASLATAAVLVFTSSYEGQGLVVLEALATGCPVVSYDLNYGPSEMIVDGETGILVPNGDVQALGAALSSVLGHPERLAELSAAAHASALERTPERSMHRMAALFQTVAERPRRRRSR